MATDGTFRLCCAETMGDAVGANTGSWAKAFEFVRQNTNAMSEASVAIVRTADVQ